MPQLNEKEWKMKRVNGFSVRNSYYMAVFSCDDAYQITVVIDLSLLKTFFIFLVSQFSIEFVL